MKQLLIAAVITFGLTIAAISFGAPIKDNAALVDRYINQVHVEQSLEVMAPSVLKGFEPARAKIPPALFAKMTDIIKDKFSAQRLTESFRRNMIERASADDLKAALESDAFRKMYKAQDSVNSPDGQRQVEELSRSLEVSPELQPRLALIKQLDEASGTTVMAMELGLSTCRAMFNAMLAALGNGRAPEPGKIESLMVKLQHDLYEGTHKRVLASLFVALHEVSDEDLQGIIAAYRKHEAQCLGTAYHQSLNAALVEAGDATGSAFAAAKTGRN